jgi:hypothetical protein
LIDGVVARLRIKWCDIGECVLLRGFGPTWSCEETFWILLMSSLSWSYLDTDSISKALASRKQLGITRVRRWAYPSTFVLSLQASF